MLNRRIAIVQFAPEIGQVPKNVEKATRLCTALQPGSVDLVCLPEMIFTGYQFPDATTISPLLEDPVTGPTAIFCKELADRLSCYVAAGYPERLPESETQPGSQLVGANSAVLYGPGGERIGGYRKTNLFQTDMSWCIPGTGFATFHLPPPLNKLTIAICMDLNSQPPAEWSISNGPYELADYCLEQKTDTLLLLNAWLDSKQNPETNVRDWRTVNFWTLRLMPLWASQSYMKNRPSPPGSGLETGYMTDETLVIICNRAGSDYDTLFAGTSTIMRMTRDSDAPKILGTMTRTEESMRIFTV